MLLVPLETLASHVVVLLIKFVPIQIESKVMTRDANATTTAVRVKYRLPRLSVVRENPLV